MCIRDRDVSVHIGRCWYVEKTEDLALDQFTCKLLSYISKASLGYVVLVNHLEPARFVG